MIVCIEGPAGAGKSTMAATVAAELGIVVIEGGSWYRALTYLALSRDIDLHDTAQLVQLAENLDLQLLPSSNGTTRFVVDGQDVTEHLYSEEASTNTPTVAQQLAVREQIEEQIVATARAQSSVIVVGRHLSKVLPEAKILRLTITDAEAERRHSIRAGKAGYSVKERNIADKKTGELLGIHLDSGTELDVSDMSPSEQANALRQFIGQFEES